MRGVAGLMLSNLILVLGVVRATTELQQSAGQFAVFHMPRCCRYSFQAMLLAMTLLRCRCCMSVLLRSTPQQLLLFLCSNLQSPLSRHMVHHLYYLNVGVEGCQSRRSAPDPSCKLRMFKFAHECSTLLSEARRLCCIVVIFGFSVCVSDKSSTKKAECTTCRACRLLQLGLCSLRQLNHGKFYLNLKLKKCLAFVLPRRCSLSLRQTCCRSFEDTWCRTETTTSSTTRSSGSSQSSQRDSR